MSTAVGDPQFRASDADRERVAVTLREHTVRGRLTVDEMAERTEAAYAARTLGDLQRLVLDLPGPAGPATPRRQFRLQADPRLRARWVSYCSTSLLCVAIWLATSVAAGAVGYFWPVWVIGPWGAALVAKTIRSDRLGPRARRTT